VLYLAVLLTFLSACASNPPVKAESPRETLNQYVSQLQNNPDGHELREKIIRHAQTMEQKPARPQEADRYMARGAAAARDAQNANDYKDAVREYEKASLAAPWLADVYYKLAVAQDRAGLYSEAINSMLLYLLAAPGESGARDLLYEIEYRKEKAAKAAMEPTAPKEEPGPKDITVREDNKPDDWLIKIDGRRYANNSDPNYTMTIDVRGRVIVLGVIWPDGSQFRTGYQELTGTNNRFEIKGREFTQQLAPPGPNIMQVWAEEITFKISEEGDSIIRHIRYSDGTARDVTYTWQR